MDTLSMGKAGLKGWRAKVADAVAQPVSKHSPLSDDQVRGLLGAAFFALSAVYVLGTVKRMTSKT